MCKLYSRTAIISKRNYDQFMKRELNNELADTRIKFVAKRDMPKNYISQLCIYNIHIRATLAKERSALFILVINECRITSTGKSENSEHSNGRYYGRANI